MSSNKPGRNSPCPCGSGRKYKKCCLPGGQAVRFTRGDRRSAFVKLDRFSQAVLSREDDEALEEFWGEWLDTDGELGEPYDEASETAFDMWFWFDRPLADGRLVVDRVIAEDTSITAAERRFLELARDSCVRLYEVVDTRPGVSVTLRDVLDDATVTVHEVRGSRQFRRSMLLAARVIREGASGEPELEAGPLHVPALSGDAVIAELSALHAEFRRENPRASSDAFFKDLPPFFHAAWASAILDPPIPELQNTDGEPMVVSQVHFAVLDAQRLCSALDGGAELERAEPERAEPERAERSSQWRWSGTNTKGESIALGQIRLRGRSLTLETNSVGRSERGRAMIEDLAGACAPSSDSNPARWVGDDPAVVVGAFTPKCASDGAGSSSTWSPALASSGDTSRRIRRQILPRMLSLTSSRRGLISRPGTLSGTGSVRRKVMPSNGSASASSRLSNRRVRASSAPRGTRPSRSAVSIAWCTRCVGTAVSFACRIAIAGVTIRIPSCQVSSASSRSSWCTTYRSPPRRRGR